MPKKKKLDQQLVAKTLAWVSAVTGESTDAGFRESLKNGVVICRLLNKIAGKKKAKYKKKPRNAFMEKENIMNYINALKKMGFRESDLFMVVDLNDDDKYNMRQVLFQLNALSRFAQDLNTFNGPYIDDMEAGRAPSGGGGGVAPSPPQTATGCSITRGAAPTKPATDAPAPTPPKAKDDPKPTASPPKPRPNYAKPKPAADDQKEQVDMSGQVIDTGKRETDIENYIEAVTGKPLPGGSLHEKLKSGVALCRLINKLSTVITGKKLIKKFAANAKMPFTCRENIMHYINNCKKLGVRDMDCFETGDLFEWSMPKQVIQNIFALSQATQNTVWPGPFIGVKVAQENKRVITAEMKAAEALRGHAAAKEIRDQINENTAQTASLATHIDKNSAVKDSSNSKLDG